MVAIVWRFTFHTAWMVAIVRLAFHTAWGAKK
jgi:hypothetical protein